MEKKRIELEAEDFKESLAERLDISKANDLHSEIKGVLDHLAREKRNS
jgi:energy-converting hydrogenase A subunit M